MLVDKFAKFLSLALDDNGDCQWRRRSGKFSIVFEINIITFELSRQLTRINAANNNIPFILLSIVGETAIFLPSTFASLRTIILRLLRNPAHL